MEELGEPRKRVPFDTNAYVRACQLAIADACKNLGWNARGFINKNVLEYYVPTVPSWGNPLPLRDPTQPQVLTYWRKHLFVPFCAYGVKKNVRAAIR